MPSLHRRVAPPPAEPAQHAGHDCRCLCGSLLARLVEGAVELKCRRCKRTLILPLSDAPPDALDAVETA